MVVAALVLWAGMGQKPTPTPPVQGTWVYHEPWQEASTEVIKESYASAVVLRFCPSGDFVLVKGVLYRSADSLTIGSSDGLEIWGGKWQMVEGRTTVTYRLKSYEIGFTGAAEATRKDMRTIPGFEGSRLTFDVPLASRLRFEPASALPGTIAERFLECSSPR